MILEDPKVRIPGLLERDESDGAKSGWYRGGSVISDKSVSVASLYLPYCEAERYREAERRH